MRSLWRLSLLYLLHIELWYILFSEEMRDSLDNIPLFSDFSDEEGDCDLDQGTGTGVNPPVSK